MLSSDCNLSSHKAHLFFHVTLDWPTTNIALLSTFNDVHAAGLWKWFFDFNIIFLIYLPTSLFPTFLTTRNYRDALVKHVKWNSSATYWIAVRHCMLRKSFLALGRVFRQPLSQGSQLCPLGLPTHLFAHCWVQLPHLLSQQRVIAQELQKHDPWKEQWQLSHLIVAGQPVLLAIQQQTQSKNFRRKV